MSPESKDTMRRALESFKGDNAYRARAAWRGLSEDQLDKQWGESGKTRREILAGYDAHEAAVTRAAAELEAL